MLGLKNHISMYNFKGVKLMLFIHPQKQHFPDVRNIFSNTLGIHPDWDQQFLNQFSFVISLGIY